MVRDAFDRIALGTERLLQRQTSGVLTVSTSPDFAAKWLVHRLGRFAEAFPEIELRVSATLHHVDFAREDIDLAVRHGDGHWTGLHVTRLCSEELFPVCSPRLATDARPLNRPADLLGFPLLHLDDRTTWATWLEAAGVGDARRPAWSRHEPGEHGDRRRGGRPGRDARPDHARRLGPDQRSPHPAVRVGLPLAKSYWIVGPKASAMLPKIVTFREWLLAEAADDARRVVALDA